MNESPIKAWLKGLSWPLFLLVCLGILGALFGLGALWWHIARSLGWWTFALLYMAAELFNPTVKALKKGGRS